MDKIADIRKRLLTKKIESFQAVCELRDYVKNLIDDGLVLNSEGEISKKIDDINESIKGIKEPDLGKIEKAISNNKPVVNIDLNQVISLLKDILKKESVTVNQTQPIKWPKDPKDAIPVVLADKTKTEFYNALASVVSGWGGSIDTSKLATSELQRQILEAIANIEVNIDSVNINTDDIEEKLDEIEANQLPDNHQVIVSNQIEQPTTPTDTQPISAEDLPLPEGAATSDNQTNGTQKTQLVDSNNNSLSSYGKVTVGNAQKKFRDGFSSTFTQPDPNTWDLVNPTVNHIITQGGNSFSAGYLRISMSPFDADSEVSITSIEKFSLPFRMAFGMSTSQRILGQEVGLEIVGVDTNDAVQTITPVVDVDRPTSVTVATANVLPITFTTAHPFHGGDRVCLTGCYDSRLNGGPLIVTVVSSTQITLPLTIATGTYNSTGGHVKWADPLSYVSNGASILLENTTQTNGSFVSRRNGGPFRLLNSTIATTIASQANTSPYTDAFIASSNQEMYCSLEEVSYRSYSSDSVATPGGVGKYTQGIPDEENEYKIRIRVKNLPNLTVPIARITNAVKTASTTATITTDVNHGLTVGDYIQIYGIRDQTSTSFPNLTTAVVVNSTPTPNTFTCIIGSSGSATSSGGAVWKIQGGVTAPGVVTGSIQSISRTSNILSVVNGSTWATPLPGEYYQLWGMTGDAQQYEGAYKVLRVSTTTLELESTGADFGSINTGGVGFKRTDVRINFVRVLDYTRLVAEIVGGRGNTTDINNAVPTALVGGTVTTVTTVSTMTNQTNIGNEPADMMAENNSYQDWGLSIRSLLI